jgi:hypothetical protein
MQRQEVGLLVAFGVSLARLPPLGTIGSWCPRAEITCGSCDLASAGRQNPSVARLDESD